MEANALEQVYGALHTERKDMSARVDGLRADLVDAETRLRDIDSVMEGLRRLQLVDEREPPNAPESDVSEDRDVVRDATREDRVPAKRIRSTEMVAEVVNNEPTPLSRDQIVDLFERRFGFPESWMNPRNAIGNALGRAVGRGWIVQLAADQFVGRNRAPTRLETVREASGS